MTKGTAKYSPLGASGVRRKLVVTETQIKKEKGRSRNACDRCKQKKVKCDGEGMRVCSICREGDYQCNYAQKPHEEKRQYRKGYVEMVEEANEYYKSGIHALYEKYRSDETFARLRALLGEEGKPTVQDILTAVGLTSTGRPHEGGIEAIEDHLERGPKPKPMLVRRGEWDRIEGSAVRLPSPAPSPDNEMDCASDDCSSESCSEPASALKQSVAGLDESYMGKGRIRSIDSAIDMSHIHQISPVKPIFTSAPEYQFAGPTSSQSSRGNSVTPGTSLAFDLDGAVDNGIYSRMSNLPPQPQQLPDLYEQSAAFNQLQMRPTNSPTQPASQPTTYPTVTLAEIEDSKWPEQSLSDVPEGEVDMLLSKQCSHWLGSFEDPEGFDRIFFYNC